MNNNEIIERLKNFVADKDRRGITHVAVKNCIAYATDGRIALAHKLPEPQDDSIPDCYPIDRVIEILSAAQKHDKFSQITDEEYVRIDAKFISRYKNKINEIRNDYIDRYKEVYCPCCGEILYWDSDNEEIVRTKEDEEILCARDIEFSVRMKFDDGTSVLIGYNYMHLLRNSFGNSVNFALGTEGENNRKVIYMKSLDCSIYGVLMPLRFEHLDDDYGMTDETVRAILVDYPNGEDV